MIIPFAEWLPDQPDFSNPGTSNAKNVVPWANSYGQLNDLSVYASAMDSAALGGISARSDTGDAYVHAGDASKLYRVAAGSFTDISKSGGYSTGTDEHWAFTKWGNTIIGTNFSDDMQVATIGSGSFADLGGSPPKARHITTIRDFVVVGNTWDSTDGNVPNRVRWSAINNSADWTVAASTQSDYQDLQGDGGWVQAVTGGEYGVVFQERAIWRMTYVGSPVVFQFDEVERGLGTPAPRSVARHQRFIFFLGQDGFYRMTDGVGSENIGTEKVNRTFFADLDQSYFKNVTCVIDPENQLVFWAYPGSGHTGGQPNKLIIYNFATDRWSEAEVNTQMIFQAGTDGYTMDTLDTVSTNLDSLGPPLDSRAWTGTSNSLGAFNHSNELCTFSGSALTASIDTKEVELTQGRRSYVDSARAMIDGGTTTVQPGTRAQLSDSVTWGTATSLNSIGEANFRSNSRYHRFRASISGGFNDAIGIDVSPRPEGRR